MIIVNDDWCKGCNICIERCPVDALEESDKLNRRGVRPPQLKQDNNCNYCRLCELLCPDLALAVIPDKEGQVPRAKARGLLMQGALGGSPDYDSKLGFAPPHTEVRGFREPVELVIKKPLKTRVLRPIGGNIK